MRSHRQALIPVAVFAIVLSIGGCASQRPVMYPNAQFQAAGPAQAAADTDACIQLAHSAGAADDSGTEIVTDAAGHAVVGGAAGAAAGAVYGNVGRGSAAGAAAAGAGSLARGLIQSSEPDALHKAFVEKCLRDRGYEPIGWK